MGKYFGTDGIRGIAFEKLDSELAFRVGQSIGHILKPDVVVIGMDTRESSPMLAYSIANGLLSCGVHVKLVGVVSTPMIAHYSKTHQIIGIMITASHNPFMDNGIKVFSKGYKTTEDVETLLEEFIDHGTLTFSTFGKLSLTNEVKELYLKIYDDMNLQPSNLKIGFDSANGANYQIAREIFNRINPRSIQIANTPNGKNINLGCGSTHLESILQLVKNEQLDIAFSFDGDGDRIILIDDQGVIYDGDFIIYMIATYLKKKNLLNKNTVVLTKMSNPGILKALKDEGINYVLTDVGDKYVFHELYTNNYTIGGESSGHIILTHLLHTGDGLLVAIYLLKILEELGLSLRELSSRVKMYPLKLTNIKGIEKSILKKDSIIKVVEEVKQKLGENSLLLVRPSGTEALIRITISHEDEKIVQDMTEYLVNAITMEAKRS
jgi:phosphoglucosamine mutase